MAFVTPIDDVGSDTDERGTAVWNIEVADHERADPRARLVIFRRGRDDLVLRLDDRDHRGRLFRDRRELDLERDRFSGLDLDRLGLGLVARGLDGQRVAARRDPPGLAVDDVQPILVVDQDGRVRGCRRELVAAHGLVDLVDELLELDATLRIGVVRVDVALVRVRRVRVAVEVLERRAVLSRIFVPGKRS
ncbi:MAG TPA: hypothetical protein VFQ65_23970 [Kofleriaceae bacterium]|nr:hypothetical protein [Kofleriaceae bacterium]